VLPSAALEVNDAATGDAQGVYRARIGGTTRTASSFEGDAMTREERQKLIEQYKDGYNEVTRSLEGFPKESLTAHPIAGKWSACEIVQHLADSEGYSAIRLRRLLTEDRPAIHAYDEAAWATQLAYNERDLAPALDSFRGARGTTAQILERMTDEDWQREGTHPEHGRYGAEDWLRIYAAHAHNHASQIRRLREALAAVAK